MRHTALLLCIGCFSITACDTLGIEAPKGDSSQFPQIEEDRRQARVGKLTGDEGIVLGGPSEKSAEANNPLGVNSFLWRASLDTLNFMPFQQVDPFGGVIITDWYENPETPGERFKVNVLIMDRQLRADSVKVALFKQSLQPEIGDEDEMEWRDAKVSADIPRQLEDAILTRARELRVKQLGN
jgi:hypothetical protein